MRGNERNIEIKAKQWDLMSRPTHSCTETYEKCGGKPEKEMDNSITWESYSLHEVQENTRDNGDN